MKTFIIFIGALILGWILEAVLSRSHYYVSRKHYKEHHFKFSKYVFFLLFPLMAVIISAFSEPKIITVFLLGSAMGTFFEWLVGWAYEKTVGQRLWTYHRFGIFGRYTSLLSIPLWGVAVVLMWHFTKIF